MNSGFSLTDILVALFLMTTVSLGLIKQQWHTSHLLNQLHQANIKRREVINLKELTSIKLRNHFGTF